MNAKRAHATRPARLYSSAKEAGDGVAGLSGGSVAARGDSARRAVAAARGQALVEFALTAPLFFFLLLLCLTAAFVTMERAAAVNATTTGARVAAGAAAGGDLNLPALAQAEVKVAGLLRPALFSTRVTTMSPGTGCPTLTRLGEGEAVVCALTPAPGIVRVEVVARPAGFAPGAAGALLQGFDLYAVVHTATFSR